MPSLDYKYICSIVRGCIKGAAHSIKAILQPTVLYFPAVEVIVLSMQRGGVFLRWDKETG